jgi:aquaporin related protein
MANASSIWRSRLPVQDYLTHCLGEFFGTFMFLLMAFTATQIANTPSSDKDNHTGPSIPNLTFIAFAFGFSLAVNCWVFFRVCGGHFNPAVSGLLAEELAVS